MFGTWKCLPSAEERGRVRRAAILILLILEILIFYYVNIYSLSFSPVEDYTLAICMRILERKKCGECRPVGPIEERK